MILYQSGPVTYSARISYVQAIFDADASITGNISVRSISTLGLSSELPDANTMPTLRTLHAAFGTENIDIYRDNDFTTAIFSNLAFGETTLDLEVPDGAVDYTYTAVGNPGAIINDLNQLIPAGRRVSAFLIGLQGGESRITLTDDRRSVETHAKLRLIQAAANFDTLDLYLVDAGTDIADVNPLAANLTFAFVSDFGPTIPGNYDLILTLPGEKTLIAGPIPLDLVNGDVVELLIIDTVDPMIADVAVTRFQ